MKSSKKNNKTPGTIYINMKNIARASPVRKEDPESIDWLLLKPKTGPTATRIFADVDLPIHQNQSLNNTQYFLTAKKLLK
jgi:hypothetical protein